VVLCYPAIHQQDNAIRSSARCDRSPRAAFARSFGDINPLHVCCGTVVTLLAAYLYPVIKVGRNALVPTALGIRKTDHRIEFVKRMLLIGGIGKCFDERFLLDDLLSQKEQQCLGVQPVTPRTPYLLIVVLKSFWRT